MKKSFVILSMALMAGNAFAADNVVAGSADAPKYYVIKAGRGVPYLSYSADGMENGAVVTKLYRAEEISTVSIWAVVPGTEEGTVNIYNYATKDGEKKAYLMNFVDAAGESYASGAVATTVGKAKDIYVHSQADGTVSFSLDAAGAYDGTAEEGWNFYTLDATNNSVYCGNWIKGDTGTNWSCYAVDDSNGIEAGIQGVLSSIEEDNLKKIAVEQAAMAKVYTDAMQTIIANVPAVESQFADAIDEINNLEVTADYKAQIEAIWFAAIDAANESLATVYVDQVVALKNVRRAAMDGINPYLAVKDGALAGVSSFFDADANFTMKAAADGGYYIYCAAANSYIGADCTVAADQASAQVFNLAIVQGGGYYGVYIAPAGQNANGINWQSWQDGAISLYAVGDAGSVWSIVEANDEAKVKDAVAGQIARIQPYIANVPAMVGNILTAGIDELNSLPFSDDLLTKAEEVANTTIANANNLLTTGINGLAQSIFAIRKDVYLSFNPETNDYAVSPTNYTENQMFNFKAVEGGIVIYNAANNIYVGPGVKNEAGTETDMTVVTDEAAAQVFTVELNNNSGYYGVSFLFDEVTENDEGETVTTVKALNMNTNAKCLHTYYKADGGSIFGLKDKGDDSSISEINVAAPAVKGIYDLSGRKLSAPVKGINIIDGKKVLVK